MSFFEQLESRYFLSATDIGISGTQFVINGAVTLPGTTLQGTLPNSRMVNATFDDANSATRGYWKYPDTGRWDPERNVNEFIAAIPSYRAKGLLAVSLSFQGGGPKSGQFGASQPWDNSAYSSDGTLKPEYASRMKRALSALDANGMVAFVQFFYFGQDQRLANEAAVIRATDQATDFLLANNFTNVVVEVANESGVSGGYQHAILNPPRITELMNRVRTRSAGKLLVTTSLVGGRIPDSTLIGASDIVMLHGNGQDANGIKSMINTTRSRTSKPIVFNEDSTQIANFDAARSLGVSWGYYDQGTNNYVDGFQSVPTNWAINTGAKRAFFDRVYQYAIAPAAPRVIGAQFNVDPRPALIVQFSEDVGGSLSNLDLVLTNLSTGGTIASSKTAVTFSKSSNTATFTFPGFARGVLPDGNYRATIPSSGISDAGGAKLAAVSVSDFFVYAGDLNRDRVVDSRDFNVLAANFGKTGRTFSQGDVDYSGTVDTMDFSILAKRFGLELLDA